MVFRIHHSNVPLLSALNQFLVCSDSIYINNCLHHIGFFPNNVNANNSLCNFLHDKFWQTKKSLS